MKRAACRHTGGPALTLEWKYVPSSEHMHSCGSDCSCQHANLSPVLSTPSCWASLSYGAEHCWARKAPLPVLHPQAFAQYLWARLSSEPSVTSNMLFAVYDCSCRTRRSRVRYQQPCSPCAPLSFWERASRWGVRFQLGVTLPQERWLVRHASQNTCNTGRLQAAKNESK